MSDKPFVHLHVHTEYSLLDGLSKIKRLVKRAKDLDMNALAITDHGTMFGVIDFFHACQDAEIKPLIGVESYLARRGMQDREKEDRKPYHMLLLAKNQTGYQNLLKIASAGQLEGYYYAPRIDRDFLAAHSEGLIATSGCLAAEIPNLVMGGNDQRAREQIDWYLQTFGKENFFLELQDHGINELKTVNDWLIETGKRDDVRYVATCDVHYVDEGDYDPHDTLLCIQSSALKTDQNRLKMSDNSYYLYEKEKMWDIFGHINDGEPLLNTQLIADMCDVDLSTKGYHLPVFPVPDGYDAETYLRYLCEKGLYWRYGNYADSDPKLRQRLDRELGIIHDMGFDTYFLIVWDLCEYAREADIWWNVRGSGAGSMAAYCLGVTNIDPIQNNLLFERFLNPGRVSMPDIDLDYPDDRRGEMIEYTARKYGEDKVAAIITFGTLGAKAAVRDVGRALNVPLEVVNQAARLIPTEAKQKPLMTYVEENPDLKKMYDTSSEIRRVIDTAKQLQGVSRHASTHAAGIIVSDQPLVEYLPLHRQTKGDDTDSSLKQVTQFPMETCESLGLLKVDFLGLSTLTIMRRACDLIERHHGVKYTMDNIPYLPGNDPEQNRMLDETFGLIGRGETIGIFQVESSGMQQMLRGMRPTHFDHIVAAISLYRPGPMEFIPQYNRRMHGEEEIIYKHEKLRSILERTYGIIIYQEQIMQIAGDLFGYDLGLADTMRRAVSKKKEKDLITHRAIFEERGPENGVDAETAGKIFEEIEYFANYGFNRCLTGDAQVIDAETGHLYTINDLMTGQTVLNRTVTCSLDNFKLEPGDVTDVIPNGVKPVYCLTTRAGRKIKATANHPFYTFEGWRNLETLKPGDLIATPRRLQVQGQQTWDDYRLITLAHLLAEGNLCHTTGVYYYTADDDLRDDYVKHMEMFENSAATVAWHRSSSSIYSKRIHRRQPQELVEWIKELGLWNKDAGEKFIPAGVFGLTNKNIALLLARMWEGDGHINGTRATMHFATVSETLARQMHHLLLRFGIVARLHEKDFKYQGAYLGYELHITGREMIQAFAEKIGCHFISETKRAALHHLMHNIPAKTGVRDVVPFAILDKINERRQERGLLWKEVSAQSGVAHRLFFRTQAGVNKNGYTREVVSKVAETLDCEELRAYAESDIYWDQIVSIEYVGEEETYDLTIPETHNFVANDVIVHNSHASDYAVITVQTAFLKTHYKEEYMAALLSVHFDTADKVTTFLGECQRLDIPILPPDVNYSLLDFDIQPDNVTGKRGIRFGLAAIKNAGVGALQVIIDARENGGPFADLQDFCHRVDLRQVGKRALESLVKVGALNAFGTRAQLVAALERIVSHSAEYHRNKEVGQISLFGGDDGFASDDLLQNLPHAEEVTQRAMLNWEKDLLGLYISSHPIDPVMKLIQGSEQIKFTHQLKEAGPERQDEGVNMVVLVVNLRKLTTKNNDIMCIAQVEDRYGSIDVVLFPRTWEEYRDVLEGEDKKDPVVFISGKLDVSRGDAQIICEKVRTDFENVTSASMYQQATNNAPLAWENSDQPEPPPIDYEDAPPPDSHVATNGNTGNGHHGEPPPIDEVPPPWMDEDIEYAATMDDAPAPVILMVVEFERSDNETRDRRRLQNLYNILTSYPGDDRFIIRLQAQNGDLFELEFPNAATSYCERLLRDIDKLAGVQVVQAEELSGE